MSLSKSIAALLCALGLGSVGWGLTTADMPPSARVELSIAGGNVPFAPALVEADRARLTVATLSVSGEWVTLGFASGHLQASANELVDPASDYPTHYVELADGVVFDVFAHGVDSVTIQTGGDTAGLVPGSVVVIRPHLTLNRVFEEAEGQLWAYVDGVKFFLPEGGSELFFWNGLHWTGDFVSDDDARPIYPGEGLLTLFSGRREFPVYGRLKTTPTRRQVDVAEINFVGGMNPAPATFRAIEVLEALQWPDAFIESIKLFSFDGRLDTDPAYNTFFEVGGKLSPDFGTTDAADDAFPAFGAYLASPESARYWWIPPVVTLPHGAW